MSRLKSFRRVALAGALTAGLVAVPMLGPIGQSTAGASGAPIVIGGVAQLQDYAGVSDGFEARVAQFNKAGGIDGRQIQFLGVTDDGGSPTTDQSVVEQLVQEKHVTMVAPIATEVFTQTGSTFLAQQKVPYSGWAVAPNWCNTSWAFSVDGCLITTNGTTSTATGDAFAKYVVAHLHKKPSQIKMAIVNGDIPTAAASGAEEANLFKVAGIPVVFNKGIIPVNGTATNYAPYVQQIEASGANAVFLSLDFASSIGLSAGMAAAGYTGTLYSPVGYSEGLLQAEPSVKAALQGEVVNSEFPVNESQSPSIKEVSAALKAIGKAQPIGLGASLGYYDADMVIQMLHNAVKKGQPLTGTGIANAANSGFTYQQGLPGGACSQTYPYAHQAGIVGLVLMQVSGPSYVVKVPYACYKNVKTPS